MRLQKRRPEDAEPDFGFATRKALFGSRNADGVKRQEFGRSAAQTPERHLRVKVTMNLDGDVLAYFKQQALETGRSYQILINDTLRDFIEGSKPEKIALNVGKLLLEDPSFIDAIKGRMAGDMPSSEDGD